MILPRWGDKGINVNTILLKPVRQTSRRPGTHSEFPHQRAESWTGKRLRGSASAFGGTGKPHCFLTLFEWSLNFSIQKAKTVLADNACIIVTCPCLTPSLRPAPCTLTSLSFGYRAWGNITMLCYLPLNKLSTQGTGTSTPQFRSPPTLGGSAVLISFYWIFFAKYFSEAFVFAILGG